MQIQLPAIFNERPTRSVLRNQHNVVHLGIGMKISQRIFLRCRLAEAQNWKCCWCGTECRPEPEHKNSATIEHVIPRSCGGEDVEDNMAMACYDCNQKRGVLDIDVFLERVNTGYMPQKQMTRKEVNHNKRMRKYRKHVERFNAYQWQRHGKSYCPESWLSSLRIPEKSRSELREMIVV